MIYKGILNGRTDEDSRASDYLKKKCPLCFGNLRKRVLGEEE